MTKLPALIVLLLALSSNAAFAEPPAASVVPVPTQHPTPDSPEALSQELLAVSATTRRAQDSVAQARKWMIPLVIRRAELQESLRIQRDEFSTLLRAARAAYTPPRATQPEKLPGNKPEPLSVDALKLAQSAYAEVLRVGGIISTDAQNLTQTEEEIERLQRVVRKAALESVSANARAQAISRRLAAQARAAAWVAKKKTATPDEIAAAVDLDARANTAAAAAKQAEAAALATTTEAARCRTLVRLVPESPAVRKALAEAARTKLLLDFASAKYAAEQLATAIENQHRAPPAVAADSPRQAGAASAIRAVPPSLEGPSPCRDPKPFKGSTSCEWLTDC